MGFWFLGLRTVKGKEELKCFLVFSIGWLDDGVAFEIGNIGFGRRK